MDSSNKILFIIGGIAIALGILTFAFFILNFSTEKGNDLTNEITAGVDNMMESKYTMYDGDTVSGSAVVNMISSTYSSDDNVYILVKTNANASGVYYVCDSNNERHDSDSQRNLMKNAKTKSHNNYITPTGKFYGEVIRNANGAIVGLTFTQQ